MYVSKMCKNKSGTHKYNLEGQLCPKSDKSDIWKSQIIFYKY